MKLQITRTGTFIVSPDARPEHVCGTLNNHILHYQVLIESTPEYLDHHGFIIDNNAIHDYFVSTYQRCSKFRSCEWIAMRACEHFSTLVTGCTRVRVQISGNPTAAWLTAEYVPVHPKPTLSPERIDRVKRLGSRKIRYV